MEEQQVPVVDTTTWIPGPPRRNGTPFYWRAEPKGGLSLRVFQKHGRVGWWWEILQESLRVMGSRAPTREDAQAAAVTFREFNI